MMKPKSMPSEIDCLLRLSARIGRDRLLTQASNGNTSIKLDQVLWIKASAKWLSNALQEDILVPVDLALAKNCLRRNRDFRSMQADSSVRNLSPSIETAMHVVLGIVWSSTYTRSTALRWVYDQTRGSICDGNSRACDGNGCPMYLQGCR